MAARGSFTAIVDMIIKTARLDCPATVGAARWAEIRSGSPEAETGTAATGKGKGRKKCTQRGGLEPGVRECSPTRWLGSAGGRGLVAGGQPLKWRLRAWPGLAAWRLGAPSQHAGRPALARASLYPGRISIICCVATLSLPRRGQGRPQAGPSQAGAGRRREAHHRAGWQVALCGLAFCRTSLGMIRPQPAAPAPPYPLPVADPGAGAATRSPPPEGVG